MQETTVNEKMILRHYKKGHTLEAIEVELGVTREIIVSILNEYRASQKVKGRYSEELMKLVAQRDCYEFKRKDIMEELGISRRFLAKAIEKYGFMDKTSKRDNENIFMPVSSDFTLDVCPECQSSRTNLIESLVGESITEGIYCLDCGNEFALKDDYIYIVKWENVD